MNSPAFLHVAKRDAQFYAIGLAMTILEVALFATNNKFGNHALELSFLIQIFLILSIESIIGVYCLKHGAIRTTIIGFSFKLIGVCFLVLAHILSFNYSLAVIWSVLLVFFVMDAAGSSCLVAAYRPAYIKWYRTISGDGVPINFIKIISYSMKWRLGLPIAILTLSVLVFWTVGRSGRTISIPGAIIIFSAMIFLRVTQMVSIYNDLCNISDYDKLGLKGKHPGFLDQAKVIFEQVDSMLLYVIGNLAFLSVTLYYVGIIYKALMSFNRSFYLAWMGGSLVAFFIYAISTLLSPVLFSRFKDGIPVKSFAAFMSLTSMASFIILWFFESNLIRLVVLSFFSIIAVIFGSGLQRKASNEIAAHLDEIYHQGFFFLGETMTGVIIGGCMLMSIVLGSIHHSSMVILVSVMFLGAIMVLRKRLVQPSMG